ncbi:Dyp-type peroxidase [Promicromonospora vindobonensis]|uniref:Dyp-type peroxidase n=1 Tax=Promicromonospora vindobonensis TaxID=195748 RepID=A0ABW5W3D5_9MICO
MRRPADRGVSRRGFLMGGAAAGVGAVGGMSLSLLTDPHASGPAPADAPPPTPPTAATPEGRRRVAFHGRHQPGITTPPQAAITYVALDLDETTDRAALRQLLQLLSDDAERLMRGEPALADLEPELAAPEASLTVTFGFGPELVRRVAGDSAVPGWLRPLPRFAIDRLEPGWSGGDLLLQVGSDDSLTLAHAVRVLLRDSRAFARPRWTQHGFRRPPTTGMIGTRNHFGQVDGTSNPVPGTADFDAAVWTHDGPGWLADGTSLVLRRIRMDMDGWDKTDRHSREQSVGRSLATGAPLTGATEIDDPDLDAVGPTGFPVIHDLAHVRSARVNAAERRIFRRAYNYAEGPDSSSPGQLFASYQADVDRQFVPIQERLSAADLLNQWTTPVGSGVYALPGGCRPGSYVGEPLFATGV